MEPAITAYVAFLFETPPDAEDTLVDDGLTICTNGARAVAEQFGGRVVGYWHWSNPTALLGEAEGGHDFALVEGYLVDGWAHYVDGRGPVLLHLTRDEAEVRRLYGDRATWREVPC